MGKAHHLYTQQGKTHKNDKNDLCPMCKESLHLNDEYSQRIGVLDEYDFCCGWMCPHCNALFDTNDKLTGIHGMDSMGEA